MTPSAPPDPLDDLLQGLSGDYASARQQERVATLEALEQIVSRVPEQMHFTNTRRFKVWGPILCLGALAILVGGVVRGSSGLMGLGAVMAVLFAAMTWQHRKAGTEVFMRLDRRQLWVDTLSAPLDMTQVVGIEVKDEGLVMQQLLQFADPACLPTHTARVQLIGNQAMALRKPTPHVRITSAGLMSDGRRLHVDEVAALLSAYRDAALAQRELDNLHAQG